MRARIGVVKTALLVGEFEEAQREAATLQRRFAGQSRSDGDPRRRAVVGRACSTKPSASSATPWPLRPRCRAAATAWPRRWRRARSSTRRWTRCRRRCARRRATARFTTPSGAIFERLHRYEEAAGAYTNYVNLLPNKDHSDKALWSKAQIRFLAGVQRAPANALDASSRGRLHTVDFKLVQDKVIVEGARSTAAAGSTSCSTPARSRRPSRGRSRSGRRRADHLHAQRRRRRRRPARAAAGADRLARAGDAQGCDVPVLIKNPPLRGIPEARDGELVAAGARLLDDHRLQDAQADDRQVAARGAGRHRAAAAACTGWRRCAGSSTASTRPTSSSTPAAR